jgi:hypothetical protein
MSFDLKKYFIVEVNEEGSSFGFMTNNLHKDFIEKYEITWSEEEGGNPFETPVIVTDLCF